MNRRTAKIALVALVAVLVVSIAASTLNSTTSTGGGIGSGGGNGTSLLPMPEPNASAAGGAPRVPRELVLVIAIVGLVFALWYLVEDPKEALTFVVGAGIVFGLLFLLLIALGELFGKTAGKGGSGLFGGTGSGSGSAGGRPGGGAIEPQAIELAAVLLLGLVFVGVMLSVSGREEDDEAVANAEEEPDVAAVARAAGRAADRIEGDAEVDNEVYRAWSEMTDLLSVPNPDSSTPREFADAAIEAGMDPGHVRELTELFEEVRYGNETPTSDREERAVAALRQIESTYGEE